MKKNIRLFLIGMSLICLGGQLLLGCETWDLPTRKNQRNCVKPTGTLTTVIQQRKVDFSITNSAGTIDQVVWDFGNNSTTATTGMTVSYTYPTSGTYTAKATLTNACGNETTLTLPVTVSDAVAPTVSLQPASELSTNSAVVGMTVTSTGNAPITRYGICYSSTNQSPVADVSKGDLIIDKIGNIATNTPVSFTLVNLQPNTIYYVRSFAINLKEPGYSFPVQTFKTGSKPSVNIAGTASIGVTTTSVNFVVTNAGSPAAIEYGVCYSSSNSDPRVDNSTVMPVATPAVGTNTAVNLTNLTPNTKYYYRSYAKLPSGEIIYSTTESFTTQVDTLVQDLIASVSFTDGSRLDVSGNNNHVNLINGPTFTADRKGKAGSAIQLDGQNDYFYMAENSTLRPAALSISIWIKPITVDRWMQIYNKSRFSDGAFEMYSSVIRPNGSASGVVISTDIKQNGNCQAGVGWQTFTFTSSLQLNTWHHVVMTYSGRSAKMYFDNVVLYSKDDLPKNTIDECIGGDLKFGAQSQLVPNYFYGALDDIRIYRKVLSASEVQALYNQ